MAKLARKAFKMSGPPPKPSNQRRRRNVTPGARVLHADIVVSEPPPLPVAYEWHGMTKAWWADIWASPMAPEYEASDVHGLFMLAVIVDQFWKDPTNLDLAKEIRLQRQAFGLSPLDRRRLQWEVEKAEEAQDAGTRRRGGKAALPSQRPDPRLAYGSQS